MACRLFGAKPLSETMLAYCQLYPNEHISKKFLFEIQKVFIQENAFENAICRMATIVLATVS